jgi:hypothetical protein
MLTSGSIVDETASPNESADSLSIKQSALKRFLYLKLGTAEEFERLWYAALSAEGQGKSRRTGEQHLRSRSTAG